MVIFFFILTISCVKDNSSDNSREDTTGQTEEGGNENVSINGPNLLQNGGLEKWVVDLPAFYYDIPEGWNVHNNSNVQKNENIVLKGDFSARMKSVESGSTARLDQDISVTYGKKIRIKFNYYVENWKTNGARTYCYFRKNVNENSNISANELREFYSSDEYYIIRGGGRGRKYLPSTLNKWQIFDEIIDVPPTANYFEFGINSYYGTTIYVDECYVGTN